MLINFESEAIVHLINKLPTSNQRINARKKIKEIAFKSFDAEILRKKEILRELRSESESIKRNIYADISRLEIEKMKIISGEYGF